MPRHPSSKKPAEDAAQLADNRAALFWEGIEAAEKFFAGQDKVHRALRRLTRLLEEGHIPYAIVGSMALNAYGYRRVTADIDLLLTRQGLDDFTARFLANGYEKKSSRRLRDTKHDVRIDVVLAGDFPGDSTPKPVTFPDPGSTAVRGKDIALLPVSRLIELKLASGMSAAHRLRDLADVLELVRAAKLPRELAEELDPSVRSKYLELWDAAETGEDDD
jgi:hypothetical protein